MFASSSFVSTSVRTSIIVATAISLAVCIALQPKQQVVSSAPPAPKPTNKDVLFYKFDTLTNRSAVHTTPDAFVYIAPGFDKEKPVHLVIYNHGMMNNLNEVEELWKVTDGVRNAPPNTVVVMPEWAQDPEALSDRSGRFNDPGFFRKMLAEILGKTPELAYLNVDDIQKISIVSYSGGWKPTSAEVYKNDLEPKVVSISFFDSLYHTNLLDPWLQRHIHEIALNQKQYHNFYNDTYTESMEQLHRIKAMLASANIEQPRMVIDSDRTQEVMDAKVIADNGLVFKHSQMLDDLHHPHSMCSYVYFPQEMKAFNIRYQRGQTGTQVAQANQKPTL